MDGCLVPEADGTSRINIEKAIDENKMRLIEVKMSLIDLVSENPEELDDIFLLRYLLSFPDNDACVEAIRSAVKYRKENASWLASAKEGDRTKAPDYDQMKIHMVAGVHKTTVHGAPLLFIRAGLSDTNITMQCITEEQLVKYVTYEKEVSFWICDRISRKEGKLTKMLAIQDLTNANLLWNDNRFFSALGASSKVSDMIHPQLVQRAVILNAGEGIKILWQIARLFMSKKTMEKICVCTGFSLESTAGKCPYASKWTTTAELPSFVGGSCVCEEGCVAGVPNDFVGKRNQGMAKK